MRFFVRTLGCKVNWLDSARISAALCSAGHQAVSDEAEAEVVVVNSCAVTAEAERKSRQQANAAARAGRRVAVIGCGPRVDGERWHQRGDKALVFASEERLLAHFGARPVANPVAPGTRTRLPLAVQGGCDDRCAFCVTRIARGSHHSQPLAAVVEQARRAAELGVREIVLTGINLAAWGCANTRRPGAARLGELIAALLSQTAIPRIRLSSLGPQYLNDAFFDAFADPRVCDHLHLSAQSGSAAVLERMRRGHGVEEIRRAARRVRARRPHAGLAADLIAGFPGEREHDFAATEALVEEIAFAKLHVFPFSPRQGTAAALLSDQLPVAVRKARAARLRRQGERLRRAFAAGQFGREVVVLAERNGTGLSGNYLRLQVPGASEGELRTVSVSKASLVAD